MEKNIQGPKEQQKVLKSSIFTQLLKQHLFTTYSFRAYIDLYGIVTIVSSIYGDRVKSPAVLNLPWEICVHV